MLRRRLTKLFLRLASSADSMVVTEFVMLSHPQISRRWQLSEQGLRTLATLNGDG